MTASSLRPGDPDRLGHYRLLGLLGEGGMGTVYLAETPDRRQVAIKVIRPRLATEAGFLDRFRSEVKRVRQVPPFCTAEVLDADVNHDPPYLVVEYIDGPSLAEIIQEHGPLSGSQLHSIAIGVTTALAAIHDAGIVHRDLKPANVLLAPLSAPKVIDFGIAKALDATNAHTEPGLFLGTIAYMGPERFRPDGTARVGTASDIFAWGAVVVYAATGRTPYPHDTLIATAGGLPLPSPDLSGLPRPLRGLVARALQEDPDLRPTAHELLDELIQAGAAGDQVIRASLQTHPGLRRAASAVQRTAPQPGRETPATLEQPPASWLRWLPPRIVAAVAAVALAAGFGAYPATSRLLDAGPGPVAGAVSDSPVDRRTDKPSRAERPTRCTLEGPLRADSSEPRAFTCPPAAAGADQTISASIALGRPQSCAAIWTHANATGSYRIVVCAGQVSIDCAYRNKTSSLATAPVLTGLRHRVEIVSSGPAMTVLVDDKPVISRPGLEPRLRPGAVTLGTTTTRQADSVTFSDVTVTTVP
ncbi:serine/threonine protein kinase [Actinoplanes sp. TRM 88003]|uniref:Serine/threonine protein kinase n=1 Tax=Paractinoplanes aksuensis TaxID=2939490 RepID=A0ABT1DYI8_9ACTN|nr:serine/threonine-protein kinase [Actinoplanes aksuensis]MCO8275857.1 serine/threonine protein kinase [Actinoplanes aksuensis]